MAEHSIPYITSREGEADLTDRALTLRAIATPAAPGLPAQELAYIDERPQDRDRHGLLLPRVEQNLDAHGWPTGRPLWSTVHPGRQRECMTGMLCHYCTGRPSVTEQGVLFLDVAPAEARLRRNWPQGIVTFQPPLCLPHARAARDRCSYGRRVGGFTAFRAGAPQITGALGEPYKITHSGRPAPARAASQGSTP
ncbi:hypothetical protein VSR01_28350 [Actinacidiphila sp. DG2A-62]|uniref:hypothetical protein n=1 Tax=Actinacidiphila sp. DG2A-62 TaxID=3108821 RepID=UPI002DB8A90A|nr:hypothetical protein [Actinacidiphila sp. DG2A-62]MEC3997202.1 hypothetical protein [Actinacidiphila sp. DG2A-62]